MARKISITTSDGIVLAEGIEGQTVQRLEGNWYFNPEVVNQELLEVTDRVYVCPHKGQCFWINLHGAGDDAHNAAWVYTVVKPNYESIKDRIAFYGGARGATREQGTMV